MKTTNTITATIAATVAAALALVAAPLRANGTPVHSTPADTAPIIGQILADQTPAPLTLPTPPPEGWAAVEVPGPHTVYVADKDVLKNYDVRPGAQYFAEPRADAPVLGLATPTDKTDLAGISGKFTQYKLERTLIGYIRTSPAPASVTPPPPPPPPPPRAQSDAGTFGSGAALVPLQTVAPGDTYSPPPPPPPRRRARAGPRAPAATVPASTSPVTHAPAGTAATQDSLGLPRMILGTFVSSKQAFRPRRPYDYQLNDDAGTRYAYVDLSRLLLTEQIDRFIGRKVVVFGTIRPVSGTKDIVIAAETLKLQ
ncbi:hypothetical protein Ga0100231_009955 [Opitutaceae bacterium TAV4]|nr:hypothetical protein Ga0100231_009955 [Opitutaceae bacterium TAV4]